MDEDLGVVHPGMADEEAAVSMAATSGPMPRTSNRRRAWIVAVVTRPARALVQRVSICWWRGGALCGEGDNGGDEHDEWRSYTRTGHKRWRFRDLQWRCLQCTYNRKGRQDRKARSCRIAPDGSARLPEDGCGCSGGNDQRGAAV